jgi:hypothetical protein
VAKAESPLVGFNNNVRHKGRVFHVQTEDSGVKRPHIVTHLFADGGRIIKSTRTDYSEHLGRSDMQTVIRRLMKEQHKAMFIALRDGQFDALVEAGVKHAAAQVAAPPPKTSPTRDKIAIGVAPTLAPPPRSEEAPPAPSEKAPATTREPVLELDVEALERASNAEPAPAFKTENDLPPPNPNTLKRPDTGR